MTDYLRISMTFLDPRFHGRADGGAPEWPPSPLRLFQAIVAANGDSIGPGNDLTAALQALERLPAPEILAPAAREGEPYCLSVPNNAMDLVGKAWSRGNYFGSGDANPSTHRTMKTVRPTHLVGGDTVHYVWSLADAPPCEIDPTTVLSEAARRVVALGWGIDLVVGNAGRFSSDTPIDFNGERWKPAPATGRTSLRIPTEGTLAALIERHEQFLNRIGEDGFRPVEPLTRFSVVGYRRPGDVQRRPFATFGLRNDDGSFCAYPQHKLIHIAGMVRHLAKTLMKASPPPDVDSDWVERYVVGHRKRESEKHSQFSYLPLPSIGARHADQAIRRVMVAGPIGDHPLLDHLARRLAGQRLVPDPKWGAAFGDGGPPTLVQVFRDSVADKYLRTSQCWSTVTPVILPGHDDRKPSKTRKLIEAALEQSGVDANCSYTWSRSSKFPKSYSAERYDAKRRRVGYLRPDHLPTQTAVHLTIRFKDDTRVAGPLVVGAGRHYGLGLLAPDPSP